MKFFSLPNLHGGLWGPPSFLSRGYLAGAWGWPLTSYCQCNSTYTALVCLYGLDRENLMFISVRSVRYIVSSTVTLCNISYRVLWHCAIYRIEYCDTMRYIHIEYFGSVRYVVSSTVTGHSEAYTGCPGENVPDYGRMFLKLK